MYIYIVTDSLCSIRLIRCEKEIFGVGILIRTKRFHPLLFQNDEITL